MLSEQQKQLLVENHNLIYKVINDMNLPIDEYYGTASEAACKAIADFNHDIGKVGTYMYNCIKYAIINEIRDTSAVKRGGKAITISYNTTYYSDIDGEGTELIETLTDGKIFEKNLISSLHFCDFLCILTHQEKTVFLGMLDGKSSKAIGKCMGVTRQAVDLIKKKVIQKYIAGGYLL